MIRINLLAAEPRPEGPPRTSAGRRTAAAVGAVVLAGALGSVLREGLAARSESHRLDERMRLLDGRLAGLGGVSARREEVERRRADLTRRVALTEALRAAQGSPARLLAQVGRLLPDDVWLTELRQRRDQVAMTGRAAGMPGLTGFVAGLEASGYFPPPIEIVDTRREAGAAAVHFEIRARFSPPPSGAAAGAVRPDRQRRRP